MATCFLTASVFPQTSKSDPKRHLSLDGLFAVEVPVSANLGGGGRLEAPFTEKLGKSYSTYWVGPDIYLQAGYVDFDPEGKVLTPTQRSVLFSDTVKNLIRLQSAESGFEFKGQRSFRVKQVDLTELSFRDATREVIYRLSANEKAIVRLTAISSSRWAKEDGLKFLDSYQSWTRDEMTEEKIRQATPQPLPGCPPGVPPVSDVFQQGLNGKVKSIQVVNEKGDPAAVRRVLVEKAEFDSDGKLLRKYNFQSTDGRPETVTVYGCIDGKRVSKTGDVPYEDRFTGYGPPPPGAKPRDPRYSTAYEIRLDPQRRISEQLTFGSDTFAYTTSKYEYTQGRVEIVATDNLDKRVSKRTTQIFDKKGHLTSMISRSFGSRGDEWRNTYRVLTRDAKGNWTKRSGKYERFEYDRLEDVSNFTEVRTITYHR
jgi:hypothetical protein